MHDNGSFWHYKIDEIKINIARAFQKKINVHSHQNRLVFSHDPVIITHKIIN